VAGSLSRNRGPLRVLIAGGGVAALEAMLALRALAEERVGLELLTPSDYFHYRPLAVAEPFGLGEAVSFPLREAAARCDAELSIGSLTSVEPGRKLAGTSWNDEIDYDVLLVACGALPRPALHGALTFRGREDVEAFGRILTAAEAGDVGRLAFAVPGGVVWPLPLYELALLTAARLEGRDVELVLVTPEEAPLELFGQTASSAIEDLLGSRGIELRTGTYPAAFEAGRLELLPGESTRADAVVALPRLEGPRIEGLPRDADGFVLADPNGSVTGLADVFAAGDVTAFPVKQGGIAAQQADAAATSIAALAGAPVEPQPFEPVLRGLLLTGAIPSYLRADLQGGRGETSTISPEPLWWPPSKIAGRYLAPFLAGYELDVSTAPPEGPGVVPVEVDLEAAARAEEP
jgi:sulfide:quinone oxidoreductase